MKKLVPSMGPTSRKIWQIPDFTLFFLLSPFELPLAISLYMLKKLATVIYSMMKRKLNDRPNVKTFPNRNGGIPCNWNGMIDLATNEEILGYSKGI